MKTIILDFDGTIVDLKTLIALAGSRTLKYLKSKYNLVLVTGSPRKEVEYILARFGWGDYFTFMVTKDDIINHKRTGLPFKAVLKKIEGKIVAIGDSQSDIQGCKQAGIKLVLVQPAIKISERRKNFRAAVKAAIQILSKP